MDVITNISHEIERFWQHQQTGQSLLYHIDHIYQHMNEPEKTAFQQWFNQTRSSNGEQRIITLLLLSLAPHFLTVLPVEKITNQTIAATLDIQNLSQTDHTRWLIDTNHVLLFQIKQTLYLFHLQNQEIILSIPSFLQDTSWLCINCNDQINFFQTLVLNGYDFYILQPLNET